MERFHRLALGPALTILSALALLSSGCSEAEGPLPLMPADSRPVTEGRVSRHYGEIRAPKGDKTLTLTVSSALGSPVGGVPEESEFTRVSIEPDDEGASVVWEAGDSIMVSFLKDGVFYYGVLRTEDGGSSQAVFTTEDDILGGTDYIFFAPCYKKFRETIII